MMLKILIPVFAFFLLIGCTDSQCSRINDIQITSKRILPIKSFVKINQMILDDQEVIERYSGSGFIISVEKDKTILLTAKHNCEIGAALLNKKKDTIRQVLLITDIDGSVHLSKILDTDPVHDICMLEIEKVLPYKAIPISNKKPLIGDKIFNISAPLAVFRPNMVPILEGYVGGEDSEHMLVTIPTMPGSSGSPIINEDMEIVGMIVSVNRHFHHIAYSATFEGITSFIKTKKSAT